MPAPAHIRVNCRHFHTCGGCSLPGVAYGRQLEGKQQRLARWFPDRAPVALLPSPLEEGFRHKVAFVFAPHSAGSRIVMGHFRAGSQEVVPVEECPVHSARGNRLAFSLRRHLASGRIPAGVLRHLLIRTTDDEKQAVVMLVVHANHPSLRRPVRVFLDSEERPDGFLVNVHDRPGPYMVGRETIRIDGHSRVRETAGDAAFLVSPTAFFQTNVQSARVLLDLVLAEAGRATKVLDLYSGSGFFAIPLAKRGARVTAVEENRQAMDDANANLRVNRLPPTAVRLLCARVEDALARLSRETPDVAVLDPPRQGCPDRVIDGVAALSPARIVYVSCNPERLAAERTRFERHRYTLTRLTAVDMFPHTDHIEAVAVFSKGRS